MNNDEMAGAGVTLFVVLVVIALIFVVSIWADDLPNVEVPLCPEDAVLVGAGQFKDDHWSEYVCGPAVDDFIGG